LDAAAAASEGGLHGCFFGEQHGGGDGLVPWSFGWRGADIERPWWLRRFGTTSPKSCSEDQTQGQQVFQFVGVREDFFGRKPRVLTPMAAMPTGVVTLFGAQLWAVAELLFVCDVK
jgi:hypothetical protein